MAVDCLVENMQRLLDGIPTDEPNNSVFVSNIFCTFCGFANEYDLGDPSPYSQSCIVCKKVWLLSLQYSFFQNLDRFVLDNTSTEKLNNLLGSYLMQDHVCIKCKSVS